MHVNIKQIYDICYQFNLYNFTLGPDRHSVSTRLEHNAIISPATGRRKSSERYGYKVTDRLLHKMINTVNISDMTIISENCILSCLYLTARTIKPEIIRTLLFHQIMQLHLM